MNLLKLNEGWRSILRQTRAAELREDLTVLSQTFERHLDGLDSIIKVNRRFTRFNLLLILFLHAVRERVDAQCVTSCLSVLQNLERDLQDAERQSAQVRRVHLQHVERLWAQQDKRLKFVQQQWEGGLQHLISRFSSERSV